MEIQMKAYGYSKMESVSASVNKTSNGKVEASYSASSQEQVNYQEKTLYIEDKLDLGNTSPINAATYKFDAVKVADLKKEMFTANESFKDMIRSMLEKQGINADHIMKRLEKGEKVDVEVDEETRAKAKENISENGFWGVKKTSERILDFAKAISNNDPSKIDMLRETFKKGFEEVKTYFNGELPEISQLTYDAVMKGFDEWENPDSEPTEEPLA